MMTAAERQASRHVVDAATGADSTVASGSGNTLSGNSFVKGDQVY